MKLGNKYITIKTILTIIAVLIPIVIYSMIHIKYSLNIPRWDDYPAILDFLNNYLECDNFSDKIKLLFSQHNEHRIVFTRIIVLLQYFSLDKINFRMLSIIGNIGWYLIILLLFIIFKKKNMPIVYFLPVIYLSFHLSHYENIEWAMASLQNYFVILFVLCSFYFISVRNNIIYSCIFIVLASFTSGSGIFSILIITLYLCFEKKWKQLFFVLFLSCILLVIYFFNYTKPEAHPSIIEAVRNFWNTVLFNLVFLGSFIRNKWAAIFIGLLLFAFFVFLVYKKYYYKYKLFFLILSYILTTGFFLSIARSGFGFQYATSSRYTIYSLLFLIIIYLITIIELSNKYGVNSLQVKRFVGIIISLTIIYNLSISIFAYKKIKSKYNDLLIGAYNYECLNRYDTLNYPDKNVAENILKHSLVKGVYSIKDGIPVGCK